VNESTNRVYVASQLTTSLTVIDGASGQILASPTISAPTTGIAVNPLVNQVFVGTVNAIVTLDGVTNGVLNTLAAPASSQPRALAVNPMTNRLYVTSSTDPEILVIDTAANRIVTSITAFTGDPDVAVNPTTNRIYTPASGGGLAVIDGASNTIVATVDFQGATVIGVGVNPVTNQVYASDVVNNRVFVVNDSPLVPTATPTATGGTALPTVTRTATPTIGPPSATLTPTPSGGPGGKGFGLSSDSAGVHLSWQPGFGQTGYSVARLAGGVVSFLPAAGLGPAETTFTDASAPPGFDCYALIVAGTNPQRVSDLLCALVGFGAGASPPRDFTIRLNQSTTAALTWNAPTGGTQDSYLLLTVGGASQNLGATATSATVSTPGFTCVVIGAIQAGALLGYTDLECGLPGFSNLGP